MVREGVYNLFIKVISIIDNFDFFPYLIRIDYKCFSLVFLSI